MIYRSLHFEVLSGAAASRLRGPLDSGFEMKVALRTPSIRTPQRAPVPFFFTEDTLNYSIKAPIV